MREHFNKKNILIFSSILLILVAWAVLLTVYNPEELVRKIGVEQGYLLIFIVAALGGVSSITAASYYTTLFTLASGGLNPWILGPIAGVGVTIGDSLFYYFGTKGRGISEKLEKRIRKIERWINKRPRWGMPAFIFVYAGFAPLPNDILMMGTGFISYPYKKAILPLLTGNMIHATILALLATQGVKLF